MASSGWFCGEGENLAGLLSFLWNSKLQVSHEVESFKGRLRKVE